MPKVDLNEWVYNTRYDTLLYVVGILAIMNNTLVEIHETLAHMAYPDRYMVDEAIKRVEDGD